MALGLAWMFSMMLAVQEPQPPAAAIQPVASLASNSPVRRVRLVLTDAVFNELRRVADTARAETVRCLLGAYRGDSAIIDLAWQPAISYADEGYVVFQGCPIATVAQWHNHLRDPRFPAEHACYLSSVDVEAALDDRAPPAQIVQVDQRVFCWWTRTQIRAAAGATVLTPIRAQHSGTVPLSDEVCTGAHAESLGCQLLRSVSTPLARREP